MASGEERNRWIVRDAFGNEWRISIARSAGPGSSSRVTGPAATIDELVEDAAAPSGMMAEETTACLLEIHDALTGGDLSRGHAGWRCADRAWYDQLDRVRTVLLDAVESGWLLCEPATRVAYAAVEEAPSTVRDVPLFPEPEPTTWFELRVVDEVGEPVPEVDIAFGLGGGRRVVPTDGRGIARLEDTSMSFVSASIASVAQLREKLAPRWGKPRAPKLPVGPDVRVAGLDAATESLSLESENLATLAVTPLFRCNELSGVHFAFARSFVLESGLGTLSVIAAAVLEDDNRRAMIFGHTDTAGSEALNKELSERRAKALFAILTHDPDTWEELWTGSADGPHFKEQWGIKEAQHLLNALGVPDDQGEALVENGTDGTPTKQALKRFQRGDYEGARAGRGALPETARADKATRKELLLSYSSLVTRDPVPKERFAPVGDARFMGCGEFNPLSTHGRDEASRRAVVFVFDAAAEPQNLPCKLRALGPCKTGGGVDDPSAEPAAGGTPYRCSIYREVAKSCPCVEGEELMHLQLQLHDRNFEPVPDTPYHLVMAQETVIAKTDSEGMVHAAVRKGEIALSVTYHPSTEPRPITLQAIVFPPDEIESDRTLLQKLRNLGFGAHGESDAFAILKFQEAHKNLKRTGKLDDGTKAALRGLEDERLSNVLDDGD